MKLIIGMVVLLLAALAHADGEVEVHFEIKPQPKGAPKLEATVIGGARTSADKLAVSVQDVRLKAERVRTYVEGSEPIAIALVISGQEIWIGNDKCEPDENAKHPGALEKLAQAIDRLQLGNQGPAGSKGLVVSYSIGAEIKVPMGDLKAISGAALGNQCDYHHKIGSDLVQGITLAMAELSKVTTPRKALIVVGDGSDTDHEVARRALAQLKKDASRANIQAFAIIYKSIVSTDVAITTMIPQAKVVNSVEGIASELDGILARMADRYYVTFPGYDERTHTGLPWDGKPHDVVLHIDQHEAEPVTLTLAPRWRPPQPANRPWLAIALLAGGALLVIVIIKLARRRRPIEPPVIAAPPVAAAAPPAPSKTVLIGAGGDQDGMPIVGWLVALNGGDAYQTRKLKPGLTTIGTAPPADIVVNDGFMSVGHCRITCSPAGYTLIDDGSTNGCYVNDERVQRQELLDNDVIGLGKTTFRFKTIN